MLTYAGAFVSAFGSGALCYWTVQLKNSFSFDDALDAFGIHGTHFTCFTGTKAQRLTRREALLGLAAIWGGMTVGFFAKKDVGGVSGCFEGECRQVPLQVRGALNY